ncbi:MAG: chemotaxis protein CheB [Nitrospirae bacterium]|nr:chemotaxis protein CheB [Nitrospirota bacterium]
MKKYEAVVIGVSAGGLVALKSLLSMLPNNLSFPIIIVQHLYYNIKDDFSDLLKGGSLLKIKQADDKEKINSGCVYIAPSNYHLLIEDDKTFSLSIDEMVNFARPSIDVLFESASDAYGACLIGIILTGANNDGSMGLKKIKDRGGLAVVQDPNTAEYSSMPLAAISATEVDHILPLEDIARLIIRLSCNNTKLQS